jgi:sialate O-acetylesterase
MCRFQGENAVIRNSRPGLAGLLGLSLSLTMIATADRPARGDVSLPSIFGSHMVLQRDQKDRVWGKASPGEKVTVRIGTQKKTATADAGGKWSVTLDPLPAGGPHKLTVEGKNKVTFDDVLVGEVWVCSGQSNMQLDLNGANDADLEILTAKYPKIRLISVPAVGTQEPKDDFRGRWEACTPQTAQSFSAIGFLFGRLLHQALDVPVGLIDDSWGGSAAEAWVRRDILEKNPKYKPLIERWKGLEKESEKHPNEMHGNARPGNIYNGVLKPTIGYGIKGAIWYQGESNAGRAYQYRDLFPLMIQNWRDAWGIGNFPFYWVQLADFLPERPQPGESGWAELREAQTMTLDRLPKTGQAVIIDIGDGKDIHPKNKQGVANRLARLALANDYGVKIASQSPRYKSMETKENKIVLKFAHAGDGLQTFDVPEARGFAIAGKDKKFVWAKAQITGKDTIEVWSDEVSEPAAVRYAWADNPVCNIYGKSGLPLTPFRTDDWKGVTADAK